MIPFSVPNLDDQHETDLLDTSKVLSELAKYARSKAGAMHFRKRGKIDEATILEDKCDEIYTRLPEWARW